MSKLLPRYMADLKKKNNKGFGRNNTFCANYISNQCIVYIYVYISNNKHMYIVLVLGERVKSTFQNTKLSIL